MALVAEMVQFAYSSHQMELDVLLKPRSEREAPKTSAEFQHVQARMAAGEGIVSVLTRIPILIVSYLDKVSCIYQSVLNKICHSLS